MNIPTNLLRALVAVLDGGGVSAGARQLGVTQSTLSDSIRRLEEVVGFEVLVRERSGALSARGALLADAARSTLHELSQFEHLAAQALSPDGELVIAVTAETAVWPLTRLVAQLNRTVRNTRVRVVECPTSEAVADQVRTVVAEVGLAVGPSPTDLSVVHVGAERLRLVTPASWGPVRHVEDLRRGGAFPFALDQPGLQGRAALQALRELGLEPVLVARDVPSASVPLLILEGVAAVLLAEPLVAVVAASGGQPVDGADVVQGAVSLLHRRGSRSKLVQAAAECAAAVA